jgi:hypothetical protein
MHYKLYKVRLTSSYVLIWTLLQKRRTTPQNPLVALKNYQEVKRPVFLWGRKYVQHCCKETYLQSLTVFKIGFTFLCEIKWILKNVIQKMSPTVKIVRDYKHVDLQSEINCSTLKTVRNRNISCKIFFFKTRQKLQVFSSMVYPSDSA